MGAFFTCAVIAFSASAASPTDVVVDDRVDLAEVNHFYDETGKLVFDQVIFYDWCPTARRFQVRAWRLLKKPSQFPSRNGATDVYESVWIDGDVMRRVRAKSFRETWTQFDPELVERAALAKERRRELYTFDSDKSVLRR